MTPPWQQKITDIAARITSVGYSATIGALANLVRRRMIAHDGRLRTTKHLPRRFRQSFANYYACRERAEIAILVANQYPGGDYFEFGSEGLYTFCNFLSAFHLNGHTEGMPDAKFFAFDVFGEPKPDTLLSGDEKPYFAVYRGLGSYHYRKSESRLRNHGLMLDRCELVKGHFEDTLNDAFKARLRAENRRVGFAFLDCNISSSYQTCFDFLQDFMREERAFIYMDEYFQTNEVPQMFEAFCAAIKRRSGMRAHYIRNAGAYGALFILMREIGDAVAAGPITPARTASILARRDGAWTRWRAFDGNGIGCLRQIVIERDKIRENVWLPRHVLPTVTFDRIKMSIQCI